MHEMSIVESLIEQVEAEIANAGSPGRVTALELVIGRLSGVHADSIRFAFELLSSGTVVDGAELRIDEPPAHVRCLDCRADVPVQELTMHCPRCGSDNVSIHGGQELLLQSIEVDED
jgi:hydrogenase nickel incorporation protein HypA/HybF